MAKNFSITLGTTDKDNVVVSESVSVRAGSPHFDPPVVGFSFPPNIAPAVGTPTGPFWPVGEYWAFAFCQVTPTPSDEGTGRFLVQYYYNSGNWRNDPARRFEQTFDETATTINGTLYPYTLDELAINTGGGDATVGFATENDVSGLRHALIITNADLTTSTTNGARAGFRNPGTDDLITAWDHDLDQNKLFTLARLEHAQGDPTWSPGTQIIAHPYHYVPVYQGSNLGSSTVLPRVLVIEEGAQFPLTGLFDVVGTSVSGHFSRLLQEVASGIQMAVRINGSGSWYLVSGVLTGSTMKIYDYGDGLSVISGTMEAVPYAVGSGLITVLPGLAGCANWDIVMTPDYHNGDAVTNQNSVLFTANPVALVPGGAPSGTLSYAWEVQPQGGAITTITNSGNSITVNFSGTISPSGIGTPIDVRVHASGSGQPTCVHSDSTGYIGLKKAITPGYFLCTEYPHVINFTTYETECTAWFSRVGANFDPLFFHHQLYSFVPHSARLNTGGAFPSPTTISVVKGTIDSWPATGTFIISTKVSVNATSSNIYIGTYAGKQTGTTDDRLTGIVVVENFSINASYQIPGRHTLYGSLYNLGLASISTDPALTMLFVPSIGTWPFSFVKGRLSNTQLLIENNNFWTQHTLVGSSGQVTKKDCVFFRPGSGYVVATRLTGSNHVFATPLPSWVDVGTVVALAPWDVLGNQETVVPESSWNRGNVAFLYTNIYPGTFGTVAYRIGLATFNAVMGGSYTIYAKDLTDRSDGTVKVSFTINNMPRETWIPPAGKLVIPNVDRSKTMIFSYTSWDNANGRARLSSLYDYEGDIRFNGCQLLGINGSATSGLVTPYQFMAIFKEGKFDPVPDVASLTGEQPQIGVNLPRVGEGTLGYNVSIVDVVKVTLTSGYSSTGTEAGVYPGQGPTWEGFLTNFPTNGVIAPDPIYRRKVPVGGATGGSCLVGWTMVTIKHQDGFAKEVPISEVHVGDMISTLDPDDMSIKWCKVTAMRSFKVDSVVELIFENGAVIVGTEAHPLAVYGKTFATIGEIEVGRLVLTEEGFYPVAQKNTVDASHTVYDLQVDDFETYVANGILVHNKRILF